MTTVTVLNDFAIDQCIDNSTYCFCCCTPISKKKVRIKKIVADVHTVWFDAKCFATHRHTCGWNEPAEKFPGFDKLNTKDQDALKTLFG